MTLAGHYRSACTFHQPAIGLAARYKSKFPISGRSWHPPARNRPADDGRPTRGETEKRKKARRGLRPPGFFASRWPTPTRRPDKLGRHGDRPLILRKEVIQPQVPLRLPCYDLVPIIGFVFGACPLAASTATSDAPNFRGLTGGVYKAQEHIHRSVADLRLLAIPASCGRVAARNLN